jgi:hypothetical protein
MTARSWHNLKHDRWITSTEAGKQIDSIRIFVDLKPFGWMIETRYAIPSEQTRFRGKCGDGAKKILHKESPAAEEADSREETCEKKRTENFFTASWSVKRDGLRQSLSRSRSFWANIEGNFENTIICKLSISSTVVGTTNQMTMRESTYGIESRLEDSALETDCSLSNSIITSFTSRQTMRACKLCATFLAELRKYGSALRRSEDEMNGVKTKWTRS